MLGLLGIAIPNFMLALILMYFANIWFGISIGQLLFKKASAALPATLSLIGLLQNGWLMAALVLYGITTLVWIWVLRHAPLHLAYPFMGLAFLIVPCLGWLFLGEPIHIQTIVGGALILIGIAIAAHAA